MHFEAFVCGGYTFKRSGKISHGNGVKVRTFTRPMSAVAFAATARAHETLIAKDSDLGEVAIIREGAPTPEGLRYLARLLSDDEARILELFGVDLPALMASDA